MKSQNKVKGLFIILAAVLVVAVGVPASADQLILNPNGAGDQTELTPKPDGTVNWQNMTTDDGDDTFVESGGSNIWRTDLYALENTAVSGTINAVTVYIKARSAREPSIATLYTAIKTEDTVVYGSPKTLTTTYEQYDMEYTTNPHTGEAWTWEEINALQAGVQLLNQTGPGTPSPGWSRATQVWVVVDYTPEECEWVGETAWADGDRYVEPGNWATYTPYVDDSTVTLYAGQTLEAGTVHFSEVAGDMVTITITLNTGWRFEDVEENVKIQDYEDAPSGNPNPGGFAHKGYAITSPFSIDVPENNFYGVHVDVEWEDCGQE